MEATIALHKTDMASALKMFHLMAVLYRPQDLATPLSWARHGLGCRDAHERYMHLTENSQQSSLTYHRASDTHNQNLFPHD